MSSTTTKCPVVLIHGVFGYGKTRPLWNSWSPYWPEQALNKMNQNHLMVDVGALSSDHDRACEAFYQLYGGRVDYGEAHSLQAGHNRFGGTYKNPLHPNWSAANPVHLIGHSFGATTALELYQLISADFFNIGSDHRWVVSLISIAGPLTGSTITHLFGLHDLQMIPYSLGHFIGAALGVWFKLHTDWPILRQVFDFKMPQWQCVNTFREILSPYGRINGSTDLAVFNLLPRERRKRNARLIHMDKIFLVAVATSSHVTLPIVEIALIVLVFIFTLGDTVLSTLALCVLIPVLYRRVRALDYASIPSLYMLLLVMRRHVRTLHLIFNGFDRELWGDNDGAVNLHSMLRPWASDSSESDSDSTASTSSSVSLEDVTTASTTKRKAVDLHPDELNPSDPKLQHGVWNVHHVQKNHMAGTSFDSDSPELYQRLFAVLKHIETIK
ncbi:hypothetical protein F441_00464 [Phytophthora nicotianae CJ01A1]|uniref:Lipase-like C-terminal domain-containing protein n=7 Tax=Phytophthora nicotianae TaxID=4792 RepID=W2REM7_PHYN3|nr:hypothetical protein PPTG_00382 [Phytophthora nicotianae INRA-310]ETI57192.1 hypothetical protein F443_00465 [Phytophthora nicotianae P1569]ETK96957.1 hypothetical protein L915_00436 [Phytophthora nicotianae]ETO85935.1 hypothetical protein F444_00462 [Phytophthora nicotianae P1976]ETP26935.1 hypothetical protein F441_00464 [Phytophthora nicotianae CJ01A1]ETP54905.1 hypothetical protein F442_00454 [Phytophthora nicotianae P10297]KUF98698.1 Unconventional myosin heavy chain 6 [Phytophthora n